MKSRSVLYFREQKHRKESTSKGEYYFRVRKPVIMLGMTFSEMRRWGMNFRNRIPKYVLAFPAPASPVQYFDNRGRRLGRDKHPITFEQLDTE